MIIKTCYDVIIERGAARKLGEYVAKYARPTRVLVVTDTNVARLYLDDAMRALGERYEAHSFVIEAGEKSKNADTYLKIVARLADLGFNRSDVVIALGGGVVGDVAGFAAASYMRGIGLVQVPTTLLAMIDSSIGGKTGIDLPQGKNLLGAFYMPSLVVIDADYLGTLGDDEMKNGMGEGVKYACLVGGELADLVEKGVPDMERFIYLCAAYKVKVTEEDAREGASRRLLNLGHTVGHALEKLSGYSLPHGVAVARGIAVVARANYLAGELDENNYNRIKRLLSACAMDEGDVCADAILSELAHDKKAEGADEIYAVIPYAVGDCRVKLMKREDFARMIKTKMSVKVRGGALKGVVAAPLSKSQAHRELIACALAGEPRRIECCDDVDRTYVALAGMLAGDDVTVNVGESGSTLRFLLPIVGALNKRVRFVTEGRLASRPLGALIKALEEHGEHVQMDGRTICAEGRLTSGVYEIDGSISSQFISGLLFALPLIDGDSEIRVKNGTVSSDYIAMTLAALERHGVEVECVESGYKIRGKQRYKVCDVDIEGDWSAGAILLAAGALAGDVKVTGLNKNSIQGDKIAYMLLKNAGAEISDDGTAAKKSALKGITFDGKNCPDIIPVMAAALAFADGKSKILGTDRLKGKESDRLRAMESLLEGLGIRYEESEDALEVFGGVPHAGNFDSFGDHRIAMSAFVAALACEGESIVRGAECVCKSYPRFFEDMRELGADFDILR